MCDDHTHPDHAVQGGMVHDQAAVDVDDSLAEDEGLSRRRFLQGVGALAGTGLVLGKARWSLPAYATTLSADGLTARSMAMHVHSSFSEGGGSMESQLNQASGNGVDVLWWTDHEWKMRARNFKQNVHFTSLTNESIDGNPWQWTAAPSGSLTNSSGGGIASLSSPNDPVTTGSLRLTAESTSNALARYGYVMDGSPTHAQRVNIFGQVWTFEVLPLSIGPTAYLEFVFKLSHHPGQAGRPAGNYELIYRFGGAAAPGSRVAQGIRGVVTLPVNIDEWNTVAVTMSDDIAQLWPAMNPRDFAPVGVSLYAGSEGGFAQGHFDYLRISRPFTTGDVPLEIQQNIIDGYAPSYPDVSQKLGLEVSLGLPHVNWFGGDVTIPTFIPGEGQTWDEFLVSTVDQIHGSSGLASYNHPFGASNTSTPLPQATQDAELARLATELLRNDALGTDILEVGYPQRSGYDLAHHVGLWDTLSRNGRFVTGNGVNDDHGGVNWSGIPNNWVTWAWSASDSEADLLTALRSGRTWMSGIATRATLDLLVDEIHPMGSVSVAKVRRRDLRVIASDLPSGGSVQVLRGDVDRAGTADPTPNTTTIASIPAADFGAGSVTLRVNTRTACFVRLSVRNASGTVVAISNPVWMLRRTPSSGIPTARTY